MRPVEGKQLASQIKRILLPVDGSDASVNAARYALRIAKLLDADITCIHVIAAPPLLRGMNPALVALYFSRAEKQSKIWISEVKQMAKKEQARVTSEIVVDVLSVPNAIIQYAKKQRMDLIIMGTRGRTGAKKLLLGSVASAVMAHAGCPVMLVR
jgi:nucleotide-binding universal stress UspA family protein